MENEKTTEEREISHYVSKNLKLEEDFNLASSKESMGGIPQADLQ